MIDKLKLFEKIEAKTNYVPLQRELNKPMWDKLFNGIEMKFPDDFKELITRYGTLVLVNEYSLINPFDDESRFLNLIQAAIDENRSGEYFNMFNTPERKGFFGENGYFPIGFHGAGGYLIWDSAKGVQSEPEILLFYSDAFEIEETHCTLFQFIDKALDKNLAR